MAVCNVLCGLVAPAPTIGSAANAMYTCYSCLQYPGRPATPPSPEKAAPRTRRACQSTPCTYVIAICNKALPVQPRNLGTTSQQAEAAARRVPSMAVCNIEQGRLAGVGPVQAGPEPGPVGVHA